MAGIIDFRALEKELEAAVAADEKYQRENQAKFRAVHQKVASYEEFRDIVQASHLKPLEKKDKMGSKRNALWNSYAIKGSCKQESEVELSQELERLPQTSVEFYRDWRRCMKTSQERYQLLLQLGPKNLGSIFQADLGFGLLGEFLGVLAENACINHWDCILQILESLSGTKRFGLNVELLSDQEKVNCRHLFEKLQIMWTNSRSLLEVSCVSHKEDTTDTQMYCQEDGPEERKLMELMHLYQIF
ncbi:coiled-coil domain-containing protein 103 [Tiliqua scincoides]|uniref:coiled-coil domain-containing protein 103 n=1 Tax=Tiliqua scincoides TaxID=71010 RepID=UPI0034631265